MTYAASDILQKRMFRILMKQAYMPASWRRAVAPISRMSPPVVAVREKMVIDIQHDLYWLDRIKVRELQENTFIAERERIKQRGGWIDC